MARLLIIVPDTDMRGRQDALWGQAERAGVKRNTLRRGDVIAFLNTAKDKIATLSITGEKDSLGIMSYYVSPHGRVEPLAIRHIPESMGANGEMDMNRATRKALEELIPPKRVVKRKEVKREQTLRRHTVRRQENQSHVHGQQ